MIYYNMTANVAATEQSAWLEWVKESYIKSMMATGLFDKYKILKIHQSDPETVSFAMQFRCATPDHFSEFEQNYMEYLNGRLSENFYTSAVYFDTVLELVE